MRRLLAVWIFGRLTRWFLKLHLRFELVPHAKASGAHVKEVSQLLQNRISADLYRVWYNNT